MYDASTTGSRAHKGRGEGRQEKRGRLVAELKRGKGRGKDPPTI